ARLRRRRRRSLLPLAPGSIAWQLGTALPLLLAAVAFLALWLRPMRAPRLRPPAFAAPRPPLPGVLDLQPQLQVAIFRLLLPGVAVPPPPLRGAPAPRLPPRVSVPPPPLQAVPALRLPPLVFAARRPLPRAAAAPPPPLRGALALRFPPLGAVPPPAPPPLRAGHRIPSPRPRRDNSYPDLPAIPGVAPRRAEDAPG